MHLIILRDLSIVWCLLHILILFMMLYRSRYSAKKTRFLTIVVMAPLVIVNMAGVAILGPERMGRLVLFPLLEWWAYRVLRRPYMELQKSVDKGWNVFAGMSVLYYLLLAVTANFPTIVTSRPEAMPGFLMILILMPLNYATIFTAMYRQLLLYRRQKIESVIQEVRQQMEVQLANQKHIHRLKHDMRAHIITLSGLLSSGQVEEAENYLQKLLPSHEVSGEHYCENPYLDAVLSHYVMKFEELGISLRLDIQVGDEILPYMELCQIFSNGLENAYEACKRTLRQPQQEVSIKTCYNKGWLLMRIKNRCDEGLHVEKGHLPDTQKKEPGHGLGLRTIQEAAQRLGGDMFCYTEKGYFILDVMVRGGVKHGWR